MFDVLFQVAAARQHLGLLILDTASSSPPSLHSTRRIPLREHVGQSVRRYLHDLNDCEVNDVYHVILREVEIPLFAEVLQHCEGNQSRAANLLGIHRATLRKKLQEYGLVL